MQKNEHTTPAQATAGAVPVSAASATTAPANTAASVPLAAGGAQAQHNLPRPERPEKTITVFLEPDMKELVIPWPKTVLHLLKRFNLRPTDCLVIHHGQTADEKPFLLTPDLNISPWVKITLRKVISSG